MSQEQSVDLDATLAGNDVNMGEPAAAAPAAPAASSSAKPTSVAGSAAENASARGRSKSKTADAPAGSGDVMDVDAPEVVAAAAPEEGEEDAEKQGKDKDAGDEEEDEDEDLDEGEYEIQEILDHKRLTGKGKTGYEYLVSWVGYGPEFNEWVTEDNFGSMDMIEDHWKKFPGGKPTPGSKGPNGNAAASSSKRRLESPSVSETPVKASKRSKRAHPQEDEPELGEYAKAHKASMDLYKDLEDWEDQITSVETVERGANNNLMVYMIMKGGEKTAQDADTVYQRAPQKMLKFYESHLKWRAVK